jgi:hypothetical protein
MVAGTGAATTFNAALLKLKATFISHVWIFKKVCKTNCNNS